MERTNAQATTVRTSFTCELARIAEELQRARNACFEALGRRWGIDYRCELVEVSALEATFELEASTVAERRVLKVTL